MFNKQIYYITVSRKCIVFLDVRIIDQDDEAPTTSVQNLQWCVAKVPPIIPAKTNDTEMKGKDQFLNRQDMNNSEAETQTVIAWMRWKTWQNKGECDWRRITVNLK